MKYLLLIFFAVLTLSGIVAYVVFVPVSPFPHPENTFSYATYEAAIADVPSFDEKEEKELRDLCASRVYHSGKKVSRSIILWHGYTNCPKQFDELGKRLAAKEYNVLIPRAPGHGYTDRMTDALGHLTLDDELEYIHRSLAIASMLGDEVTVVGLSGGGTFALWSALYEERADRVISIAPVAYPTGFAPYLRNVIIRYTQVMPNEMRWWDEKKKETLPGAPYSYRRYASSSMGLLLQMSSSVEQALEGGLRLHRPITFVINEADTALREDKLVELSELFHKAGADVQTFFFEKSKGFPHDLIDEHNIKEHKEEVYGKILEVIK